MAKDKEEKQEAAPAEEPKKSGGLGTGAIIGIIGGFVVLLAVLVAVFFLFIMPKLSGDKKGKGKDSTQVEKGHGDEHGGDEHGSGEDDELAYKSTSIRVGKIITLKELILNANGSLKNFIVVDVGIEIPKTKHEMEEEDKKLAEILEKGKAEGGGDHGGGGGGGGGPKIDEMLGEGVEVVVKDKILNILASRTKEELQLLPVRDSVRKQIQVEIQPFFRKIKVRNVYFSRFIIQ